MGLRVIKKAALGMTEEEMEEDLCSALSGYAQEETREMKEKIKKIDLSFRMLETD